MTKKSLHTKLILASSFVLIAFFQNCSEFETTFPKTESSQGDFFAYPYSSAPTFYSGIQFFITDGVTPGSNLGQFTIVATAVNTSSPTAAITYDVTVKTTDGRSLCPEQTGTLATGATKIQFGCTAQVTATQAVVQLTTTANGQSSITSAAFP